MPKNMGKGGKSFKAGNAKGNTHNQKRELIYANPEQFEEYAQVKKALGCLRLELLLAGGKTVIGAIRGAMTRKDWIAQGDVVLVARREFNSDDVVDIIYRYNSSEVRKLIKDNQIPRDFRAKDENDAQKVSGGYEFVEDADESDEDQHNEANTIDRFKVVMEDPLAQLEDL